MNTIPSRIHTEALFPLTKTRSGEIALFAVGVISAIGALFAIQHVTTAYSKGIAYKGFTAIALTSGSLSIFSFYTIIISVGQKQSALDMEIQILRKELDQKGQVNTKLQQKCDELQDGKQKYERLLKDRELTINKLQSAYTNCLADQREMKNAQTRLQQKCDELQGGKQKYERLLKDRGLTINKLQSAYTKCLADQREMKNTQTKLQAKSEGARKARNKEMKKCARLRKELKKIKTSTLEQEEINNKLKGELASGRWAFAKLQKKYGRLQKNNKSLQFDQQGLLNYNEELKRKNKALIVHFEKLKTSRAHTNTDDSPSSDAQPLMVYTKNFETWMTNSGIDAENLYKDIQANRQCKKLQDNKHCIREYKISRSGRVYYIKSRSSILLLSGVSIKSTNQNKDIQEACNIYVNYLAENPNWVQESSKEEETSSSDG